MEIPGGVGEVSVTIDYSYDPLYRLTEADYSTGEYFWYTYDAVGNRLTQETHEGMNTYAYDIANRLVEVDGVAYTWDSNGNLLSDGVSAYTYDHANRLSSVVQGDDVYTFAYNGLGDRLRQSTNGEATNYKLDLVAGLTQVLDDGSNAYLYGLNRIGEEQPAGWAYHVPDALGSVRQLTDANGGVALAKGYQPFGSVMASIGAGETIYSFTGEWADGTGLLNLRARYYDSQIGRFIRRDDFVGGDHSLLAPNLYLYVMNNPINWIDPSGYYRWWATTWEHRVIEEHLARKYGGPGDAWKMHLEYPIGGSRYYGGIVDLIYFSDAYDMKSSFYPISNLGYVYEIKPHYGQMSIINAKVQLQGYLNALSLHSSRLAHSSDPEGIGYDWRGLSWEAGILPIPPRTEIILLTGGEQLIVWFEGDGAIMYAKSNWSRVQPEAFKELPPIIAYDWLKWLKDQGREADYKDQIENLDWEGDLATENAIGSPFPLPDIVEDIAKATGISIGWIVGCYAVYKLGSIFTLGPGSFALP